MCVSETRIKGDPLVNISLPQYNLVHDDSTTRAGGVAIYVSKKFRFETEPKFKMKIDGCEDLWLNILDKNSVKKFTDGAIYRHPNGDVEATEAFSEALSHSLNKISKQKRIFYLLGDLNINISANTKTGGSETYLDHLISSGSIPTITLPTRVTDTSSTLIDHIITNDTTHKIKPGVIRCDNKLSHYYVIYCNVSGYTSPRHNKLHYFFRDKRNFKLETYLRRHGCIGK